MKIINRNLESLDESQDKQKKEIMDFIRLHEGELVLDFFEVVRLIGFAEDEDDYYYIVNDTKRGEVWESCCMLLIPLKRVLPDEHYERLDNTFKYNEDFYVERKGELYDSR